MTIRFASACAALLLALPLAAGPAISAGGGDSGDGAKCTDGQVWDADKKKCVDPAKSDLEGIYGTGRDLALAGRYDEAIMLLSKVAHSGDPRVLNYLGYSHRMSGRVVVGLGYYQEALRIDPDHTLVREYMGEAYLQLGLVDQARAQLAEIERRCGVGCAEYAELSSRIAAHVKGGRAG